MVTSYGVGRDPCTLAVDLALADVDRQHLAAAGVGPAALQTGADVEALQHGDPALGPPDSAELAALRLGLDAALRRAVGLGSAGKNLAIVPHRLFSHRLLAQREQVPQLVVGQFRQPRLSPVPTTCAATSCFRSIISSIFSSSVPTHRNLCTCTFARLADAEGPVGRLVLHGRVPPAVEVEDVVGGRQVEARAARLERQQERRAAPSASSWKRSTIRSRCFAGTPPCRNSTSRPNVSCRCR